MKVSLPITVAENQRAVAGFLAAAVTIASAIAKGRTPPPQLVETVKKYGALVNLENGGEIHQIALQLADIVAAMPVNPSNGVVH